MSKKGCLVVFPIVFSCLFRSCDRLPPECINKNPVFDKFAPESDEYKAELAKILATRKNELEYFTAREGSYNKACCRDYMVVRVFGKGICAKGMFDITGDPRFSNFIRVGGYGELELSDFRYRIDTIDGHYHFTCTQLRRFVD